MPESFGEIEDKGPDVSTNELFDTKRYPINRRGAAAYKDLISSARDGLADQNCARLAAFIRPNVVERMQAEAAALVPQATYTKADLNPYFTAPPEGLPEDHPLRRLSPRRHGMVRGDRFARAGLVWAVFRSPALVDAIVAARPTCLDRDKIDKYQKLSPPNGRMRALMDDIFSSHLDQCLWIPPSLPYYSMREGGSVNATKALVFSSWSMVPDTVAAILSYEAERRMGVEEAGMFYFDRQRPRPLQFRYAQGRLAGLRALLLIYPSPVIAAKADPLDIVAEHHASLSYEEMRSAVAERLRPLLRQLQECADIDAEVDNWEWAGPSVLDAIAGNKAGAWLEEENGFNSLGDEAAFEDHVTELKQASEKKRGERRRYG